MSIDISVLHPLFKDCIGEDGGKYPMGAPWFQRGYIVACNGRMACLVQCAKDGFRDSPGEFLDVVGLWNKWKGSGESCEFPALPDLGSCECFDCMGTGHVPCPCTVCNKYNNSPQHLCKPCKGTGTIYERRLVGVGGWSIWSESLAALASYGPDLEFPDSEDGMLACEVDGLTLLLATRRTTETSVFESAG